MSALKKPPPPTQPAGWVWVVLGALFALAVAGSWFFGKDLRKQGTGASALGGRSSGAAPAAAYGGSASCQSCHAEEYKLWAGSHHALAQRALDEALDREAIDSLNAARGAGQATTLRRSGADYEVLTSGLNRTQEAYRVEAVLGVSPLRQLLVGFPGGRWQTLARSYDPRSNDWFNVFGEENRRPGEWGHWTGRGMNWNSMCASCHNTRVQKNYDPASDTYGTTLVESGVGCEACHGPLGAHDDWQKRFGKSGKKDPTLPRWPVARVVENCGSCHSRRGDLTGGPQPGGRFLDQFRLEIPDSSDLFYADGQVHAEDYEYAAFLGSRMHARGVSCGDCHNPHSAKTILPGNWLCLRCHNGSYTNAPVIDPVSHSHHKVFGYTMGKVPTNTDLTAYLAKPVAETGGECVNCHMPQTVYMQRHGRHDHGFTTPDPLLTKETGVPNACNRCHKDKDADWALQYCNAWYGSKMDRPSRQRARWIASARRRDPSAQPALIGMLRTNELGYWRAVAAGLLQAWADHPPVRQALLLGLKDTNALVRAQCARALEPLAEAAGVAEALHASLQDPVREVRLEAAWALRSSLDLGSEPGRELLRCLAVNADQPAGQMQLGALALARGDAAQAAAHYQKAAEWDPDSALIRHDYAVALSTLQRPREAVEQLQAACQLEPANAEFRYKLALGWNELGQTAKVIECLQQAVRLDPGLARAWYNLGLALSTENRSEEALNALNRAEAADPSDPRSPYAQATILANLGRIEEAKRAAQRALELAPDFEAARELMQRLTTGGRQ